MKITINSKNYKVKFGYGAIRRIVEFYGYSKPSDYDKLVKEFKLDKIEDPSFDQLNFLGELFKAAIENAGEEIDFSTDDLLENISSQPTTLTDLIDEFQKSQVQPDVNPDTRGKSKK